MSNPYAVNKLVHHPETLRKLRDTGEGNLLSVHLMPQNLCNHRCEFCSYRMPDNKNSEEFNEGVHIPLDKMVQLLHHFSEMGVEGVEITGGGEPLAYPHINELFHSLEEREFAIGLVTNGTLHEKVLGFPKMSWARVSIDASTPGTYSRMRKTTENHFTKAWSCVKRLADVREKMHPDFRLGVGFVLSNENIHEVWDFVQMAKHSGADNVRLSLTFADSHLNYFKDQSALEEAVRASKDAVDNFSDETFHVHNLIPDRYHEQVHHRQNYKRCPTKDVLCVVEGEGKVYSCCTFTGSKKGLWGNFMEHPRGFKGVWEDAAERRKNWNSRVECQVACLYRDRNLAMNELIDNPPIHTEFV